jgi:hypothetical protein
MGTREKEDWAQDGSINRQFHLGALSPRISEEHLGWMVIDTIVFSKADP